MQMGLRIISNKWWYCLANVMNACECLQVCLQTLQTYIWIMQMSYQCCHCLAIFLQMMRIFDDEAAIGINTEWIWCWAHCFLEFIKKKNSGKTQEMGNDKRYKRLANALRTLQMLPNALPSLRMACECLRKFTANDSIRNICLNSGDAS